MPAKNLVDLVLIEPLDSFSIFPQSGTGLLTAILSVCSIHAKAVLFASKPVTTVIAPI
jgi:hypothetical protein